MIILLITNIINERVAQQHVDFLVGGSDSIGNALSRPL